MRARLTLALVACSFVVAGVGAQNLTPKHRLTGSYYWQQQPAQTPEDIEFLKGTYSMKTPGLALPVVVREIKPKYTPEGMRAKIAGVVKVQLVVGEDGKVTRARVTESLDKTFGLDDAALDAARGWTFKPGTLDGKAVPVAVELILEYRLK